MKSLNTYLKEDYIRNFVEAAKILLENDPFISFGDLLAEHKVIPAIRKTRPPIKFIEESGYRHDGMGNIIGKYGRILKGGWKPSTNGKQKYTISHLRIPGYGHNGNGNWTIQEHTLIFALVHRRWPRDGYVIDHIDNDTLNNHPDNLREITHLENNYIVWRETGETENDIEPIKTNNIDTHTNLLDFLNDGTI